MAVARKVAALAAASKRGGRSAKAWPASTAASILPIKAKTIPQKTGKGRKRVANALMVNNALSPRISVKKTVPNAATNK